MSRGKKALILSVVIAVLSFLLMKGMYLIDPITSNTGMLTALVFIFVNFPMWLMSGAIFIYGLVVMIKDKKKGYPDTESHEEVMDMEIEEEK